MSIATPFYLYGLWDDWKWKNVSCLQSMHESVFPPPDRIVWIYAQDQLLYHELKESIPCIEFVCGIPENINEEGYFNVDRNNVLVLDDMMTVCKDDDRVTKLFSVESKFEYLLSGPKSLQSG